MQFIEYCEGFFTLILTFFLKLNSKEALDEQFARELATELRSRREKKTMNYNINA